MGREETDDLTTAQILYPCMQCADIFFLKVRFLQNRISLMLMQKNTLKYFIFELYEKVDICQLGGDQRKVNMLAREYCDDLNYNCFTSYPLVQLGFVVPQVIVQVNSISASYLEPSHEEDMLSGLSGQEKMSKSDPNSAIYMEDQEVS